MTQTDGTAQRQIDRIRPMPRQFTKTAWWRFSRDRRRRYLARLPGPPTDHQDARIETMVRLEWGALVAEYAAYIAELNGHGTFHALKEARENRRLLDRLMADHERSVAKAVPPALPSSYAEVIASRRAL